METDRAPTRDVVRAMSDSRRWRGFVPRPGDVVVTTPPKSGTTWMQGIVLALLWPAGDAPGSLHDLSTWVEWPLGPAEEVHAHLAGVPHRRLLKTHTPADAMPLHAGTRYLAVYRDGRDALMSWANHLRSLRPEAIAALNGTRDEGVPALPDGWDGDMDALLDQWLRDCDPVEHLASWWPLRGDDDVLLVHYADLTADLEGEMRRVAGFLGIEVEESRWPDVVERCLLDSMRAAAADDGMDRVFDGGADAFFHRGGGGRWRGVLTGAQLGRWERHVAEGLPDDAARWLAHGSLALDRRP